MTPENFAELLNLTAVSHLLHFLAVAFAIDLAYITLEPFRYTRRVRDLYELFDAEIAKLEGAGVSDSAIPKMREELSLIKSSGLGPRIGLKSSTSLFRKRCMFGTRSQSGWDVFIVSVFIVVLFILLIFAATKPFCFKSSICIPIIEWSTYFTAIVMALMGSFLPTVFVFVGNLMIRSREKQVIKKLKEIAAAHAGVHIDVDDFEKRLREM
jgi:uncharacterized integral membrane protein